MSKSTIFNKICRFFAKRNAHISKIKGVLVLKEYFLELHTCSYFIKEKLTNKVEEENQNDTINSIKSEVEIKKTVTLIQDIETPKPFTKNIPGETITAKYGSIDMFYTFQDDYIE